MSKAALLGQRCLRTRSYLHTIAGQIGQIGFDYLDATIAVIGAYNWIVPPAEMENDYFPQAFNFLHAYRQ